MLTFIWTNLSCSERTTHKAGLNSYYSFNLRCKHEHSSANLVEAEYGFDWRGHDLRIISKGRKWVKAQRKCCALTHWETHDMVRKHPWGVAVPSCWGKVHRLYFISLASTSVCIYTLSLQSFILETTASISVHLFGREFMTSVNWTVDLKRMDDRGRGTDNLGFWY